MTNNSGYKDKINYQDCFVAFLDILGFKKLVLSKDNDDKKKINQYFETVDSSIAYLKNIPEKSDIGAIVISDSVILSVIKKSSVEANRDLFRHFCISVGLIQQKLAKENLWLRGGISSGEASFDELKKQIVGPAYVNSYELENKYAKYPRVIIDSKIIHELGCQTAGELIDVINKKDQGGLHFLNWEANILFYRRKLYDPGIYIPHDIPLFIDYLSPNREMGNQDLKLIIENLKNNLYGNVEFYDKYRWIVDYLKSIYLCPDNNDLEIEEDDNNIPEVEEMLFNL